MLPQEQITETIHEVPPVSDWSLWGLRFLVQPAKQVKPRYQLCLLKTFFVSGLQAVLQALDSGHSVTALVKEFFPPPCFSSPPLCTIYRTRVRSMFTLVTNWLTHSCWVDLIDVTMRLNMPSRRCCYCWCWCWETCWRQFGADLEAEVWH